MITQTNYEDESLVKLTIEPEYNNQYFRATTNNGGFILLNDKNEFWSVLEETWLPIQEDFYKIINLTNPSDPINKTTIASFPIGPMCYCCKYEDGQFGFVYKTSISPNHPQVEIVKTNQFLIEQCDGHLLIYFKSKEPLINFISGIRYAIQSGLFDGIY